jgi:hypothetical protein
MKKYLHLSVICCCLVHSVHAQEVVVQHTPLYHLLLESADTYGIYFTIEGACPSNIPSDMLLVEGVSSPGVAGDIKSVISVITNSITNMIVLTNAVDKRIYHIVDKRLSKLDDYAIIRVLTSIRFEGDAYAFLNHIKQTVTNVLNETMFSYGSDMSQADNEVTRISIDKQMVTMRDALSEGVDLHGYSRIIWTAFTPVDTHQTIVHFLGPAVDMEQFKSGTETNQSATNKP